MVDVKVYDPCPRCNGVGYYEEPPACLSSIPAGASGVLMFCQTCSGSGRGKIKEIKSEPDAIPYGLYSDTRKAAFAAGRLEGIREAIAALPEAWPGIPEALSEQDRITRAARILFHEQARAALTAKLEEHNA